MMKWNILNFLNTQCKKNLNKKNLPLLRFKVTLSKYDCRKRPQVGRDFNGQVPEYSHNSSETEFHNCSDEWAIIGDATKISTFTNLKLTQIIGSKQWLYFLSSPFLFNE